MSTDETVETETFINITSKDYKINTLFIKSINFNNGTKNNGTKIHRQGKADIAGTADSAAGGKERLKARCKVGCLLVRIQWHTGFDERFSQPQGTLKFCI